MDVKKKKMTVGGQAVIEGVMMRTPHAMAVAVRRPSGEIVVQDREWESLWTRWKFLRWPLFRGSVVLLESMVNGIQALTFSANEALEEGYRPGPLKEWRALAYASGSAEAVVLVESLIGGIAGLDRTVAQDPYFHSPEKAPARAWIGLAERAGMWRAAVLARILSAASGTLWQANELLRDRAEQPEMGWAAMTGSILLAFVMGVLFFVALPHYLTAKNLGLAVDTLAFHAVDGLIKVVFLLLYITAISLMKDIRRVFMYHGAEHKSVFAFEQGKDLTLDNVRPYATLHPRCGTAFLLFVIVVSVLIFTVVFPFMPRFSPSFWLNNLIYVGIKIPLLFPIAGISYEIIKLSDKKPDSRLVSALSWPGLMMQRLTTREPTDDQIMVAIRALDRALAMERKYELTQNPKPKTPNPKAVIP